MSVDRWNAFVQELLARHKACPFDLGRDAQRFTDFVDRLPGPERIPLLLHAYDCYRDLNTCGLSGQEDAFQNSCYSILISTILGSKIRPDEAEALEILRKSYHRCGHGSDVEPPLALADRAFRNRPYSQALFDAVGVYRETLLRTRSTTASNVKRKLNWVLWHDGRYIEKRCCTRRIQIAIHAMDPQIAFAWQWLLRNTAAGLNSAPGKAWVKEGKKRLSQIGEEEFLRRLDEWFKFHEEEPALSPAGSAILRLLVWYGSLIDVDRSHPLLVRIVHVHWAKPGPALKVISALAWLLRSRDTHKFDAEIKTICRDWSSESAEVKRLQEVYLPDDAAARQKAEREVSEQRKKEFELHLSSLTGTLEALFARTGIPSLGLRKVEPSH
jgi:hypothetical protein